jgi:4-hydroxybenzoate polyprenyltransferase
LNGITAVRNIPDYKMDIEMNVNNFTATYGVRATRLLELLVAVLLLVTLSTAISLGFLSVFGLPILILTSLFKILVLKRTEEGLRDPMVWKRFAQLMVVNSSAIFLSIFGIIL